MGVDFPEVFTAEVTEFLLHGTVALYQQIAERRDFDATATPAAHTVTSLEYQRTYSSYRATARPFGN